MNIIWSDFASKMLLDIFEYYKKEASISVVRKIKNQLFLATKILSTQPGLGQKELNLLNLKEDHRYLITGNFKIIYKRVKEGVLITDVFHTSQNPEKLITRR